MTTPIPELTALLQARFWAKVDVRGPDECWPWKASTTRGGYGKMKIGASVIGAHRIAMVLDGRAPKSRHALHRCDNPPCCNPAHLFAGMDKQNVADKVRKGRVARGEGVASAKLTAEAVRAIRNDRRIYREIAADYGVSATVVGEVKRRISWGHVA